MDLNKEEISHLHTLLICEFQEIQLERLNKNNTKEHNDYLDDCMKEVEDLKKKVGKESMKLSHKDLK